MSNRRTTAGSANDTPPPHYRRSPLFFLICSVFVQTVVLAAVIAAMQAQAHPAVLAIVAASVGWGVSIFLRLPAAWRVFNAVVLPLVAAGQLLTVPGWAYLGCAAAALLLYLPTLWSRVPYYPTSQAMYEAVLRELPPDRPVRFIDLGCGFGGLLCYLARQRPESTFVGVELSPLAYLLASLRVRLAGVTNISIQFRDLWRVPLAEFTVVYAFLAPPPMAALWQKASQELAPGSLFLVNSFPVPGVQATEIPVLGQRQVTLYRYLV